MTRDELIALLAAADPLEAVAATPTRAPLEVRLMVGAPPAEWLVDTDDEGAVAEHRAAHEAGRPSEAVVRYGIGTTPESVADRLLALAALADDTGMLRAVRPESADGTDQRPGSWGVEDLTIVAAARAVLPDSVLVVPSWERIGPGATQVAAAFGATGWRCPEDATVSPEHLARSVAVTLTEDVN